MIGQLVSYWAVIGQLVSYWAVISQLVSYWVVIGRLVSYWAGNGQLVSYWALIGQKDTNRGVILEWLTRVQLTRGVVQIRQLHHLNIFIEVVSHNYSTSVCLGVSAVYSHDNKLFSKCKIAV